MSVDNVTKAEKSNVKDIWNDISNSDSVYKRLLQFGMRCEIKRGRFV